MASPNGSVYKMLTAILAAALITGAATWLVFGSNTVTREQLQQQLGVKANKETVDVQFENIIDQLERINLKLDRMEGNDD